METLTMEIAVHREAGIEWSVMSRALPGEVVSGDQHVVVPSRDGVLLAVIDGLGHGNEATEAARRAAQVLAQHADEPLVPLLQQCHRTLRDTRGAAMTLLAVNRRERCARALGVGNVEMVLVHADLRARKESVLLRSGVVGYQLPTLQASAMRFAPGDLVVFATDGVREDFGDQLSAAEPLPRLVERIVTRSFRVTDDALVLACRLLDDES